MFVSTACVELIKRFEGLRLKAYQDAGGVWTIGWGHTGANVKPNSVISEMTAEDYLRQDIARACNGVLANVIEEPEQGQLDALTSFVFNLGENALANSTLLKLHNAEDFLGAANEFGRWVYVKTGGVKMKLPGLVARRAAEAARYLGK